jgi:hypothetical protein
VLFFDDFSTDTKGIPVTALNNWDFSQGNVDLIDPTVDTVSAVTCSLDRCLDLDGTNSTVPAIIASKNELSFQAGVQYQLTLNIPGVNTYLSGKQYYDGFTISVGTLFSETFPSDTYSVPLVIDRTFTPGAPELARIQIEMTRQPDNFGPYLSDVELKSVPVPTVPTLSNGGLFLLAVLLIGISVWALLAGAGLRAT